MPSPQTQPLPTSPGVPSPPSPRPRVPIDPRLPPPLSPLQDTVDAGVAALRRAVEQIDRAGVFSPNETAEDIPTAHLKYALAPFYLAEILTRVRASEPSARLPIVTETARHHADFLALCRRQELLPADAVAALERDGPVDPATARAEKVARFKRERAIRDRVKELDEARRARVQKALAEADWDDEDPEASVTDSPEDDADERERWSLLVEEAANASLDARANLETELEMLRRRDEFEAEREGAERGPRPRGVPSGTGMGNYFIGPGGVIEPLGGPGYVPPGRRAPGGPTTPPPELLRALAQMRGMPSHAGDRSAIARDVFRPGHVLPTMTIEEAGEIEYREMVEREAQRAKNRAEAERAEAAMTEEEREERDLQKARQWDEFKDDNPYGSGNSKLRPCS